MWTSSRDKQSAHGFSARVAASLCLMLCLFLAPWWVGAVLAVVFIFVFTPYWEVVVFALIADTLYTFSDTGFVGAWTATVCAIFLLLVSMYVRNLLR